MTILDNYISLSSEQKILVVLGVVDMCHTANPFPVMTAGISLCTNSHREFPAMNTGSLQ